ncbi:cell division protein ZapE [Halioglobus japonicus]|nr:cell division protein ZapE [Halioglobus japonicus]
MPTAGAVGKVFRQISAGIVMSTPWQRYQSDLQREGFSHDPAQEEAVRLLQDLYERLVARYQQRETGLGSFIRRLRKQPLEPEVGLYLWGGVGRGKTYLVDTFHDSLPFERKLRIHFHRFMQRVHSELTQLEGEKNPLEIVADRLAEEAIVICFDEFFVTDIGDAMILGGLMEALFARGVSLVATSNIVPENLYENGLQRQRFLPAIALVQKYTKVVNVDAGIDYRLRTLQQAELYHYPLDQAADLSLRSSFEALAVEPGKHWERIEINGRYLTVRCLADDVAWFEFAELCDGPRSQNDYIELARIFHAVLLSGVPRFTSDLNDQARRFINLVDEFYDRNVKLVLTAQAPLLELYASGSLEFEFQRTQSRLQEMQSHEYLAREHRP